MNEVEIYVSKVSLLNYPLHTLCLIPLYAIDFGKKKETHIVDRENSKKMK